MKKEPIMEQLSRSEEQVMAALWACSRTATRREIASHLPPECRWADSTLLNFLLRRGRGFLHRAAYPAAEQEHVAYKQRCNYLCE